MKPLITPFRFEKRNNLLNQCNHSRISYFSRLKLQPSHRQLSTLGTNPRKFPTSQSNGTMKNDSSPSTFRLRHARRNKFNNLRILYFNSWLKKKKKKKRKRAKRKKRSNRNLNFRSKVFSSSWKQVLDEVDWMSDVEFDGEMSLFRG